MNHEEFTFVAALHGNELTPYFALLEAGVPVVCGNPRAANLQRRFVERDLNASFGEPYGDSLEELQAERLLRKIPEAKPVIDLHTYSCESPPFVVVVDREQLALAERTGIKRIVLMTHNIKAGRALINHRVGVSPEVGMHGSEQAWNVTLQMLQYLGGKSAPERAEHYEVVGTIQESGSYQNFLPHPAGFIPILAGEKAYQHHGLMARRVR